MSLDIKCRSCGCSNATRNGAHGLGLIDFMPLGSKDSARQGSRSNPIHFIFAPRTMRATHHPGLLK
jgi:hypothetical protein